MNKVKAVFGMVPPMVLWLMFSVLLWGFVFLQITDTTPDKKVTLCVDAQTPGGVELAARLEEALSGSVRMVKVRPFTYAMFDGDALRKADLYLVRSSQIDTYRDWFRPLPEACAENAVLTIENAPYGLLGYDAAAGRGAAASLIQYAMDGQEAEDYYLLFGQSSLHTGDRDQSVDSAAVAAARALLAMWE